MAYAKNASLSQKLRSPAHSLSSHAARKGDPSSSVTDREAPRPQPGGRLAAAAHATCRGGDMMARPGAALARQELPLARQGGGLPKAAAKGARLHTRQGRSQFCHIIRCLCVGHGVGAGKKVSRVWQRARAHYFVQVNDAYGGAIACWYMSVGCAIACRYLSAVGCALGCRYIIRADHITPNACFLVGRVWWLLVDTNNKQ